MSNKASNLFVSANVSNVPNLNDHVFSPRVDEILGRVLVSIASRVQSVFMCIFHTDTHLVCKEIVDHKLWVFGCGKQLFAIARELQREDGAFHVIILSELESVMLVVDGVSVKQMSMTV